MRAAAVVAGGELASGPGLLLEEGALPARFGRCPPAGAREVPAAGVRGRLRLAAAAP